MQRGLVAVCVCLQKPLQHLISTPLPWWKTYLLPQIRRTLRFLTNCFPQEYDSDEEEEEEKERLPPVVS